MHFDGDHLQVREAASVAWDTVCTWVGLWKHWGLKGASFPRFMDRTANMPFVRRYRKRRYAECLATYIGELDDSYAVPSASLALFCFPYPRNRLWFNDGINLWWRDVDNKVRRHAQGERRLTVPCLCVDMFVIPPSSCSEMLLSPFMAGNGDRGGPLWTLVPRPPVLVFFNGLVFNKGDTARLIIRIAQTNFTVMTA